MVVAAAPPAEEFASVESGPKEVVTAAPSIVTVPEDEQETAETRDVGDTPPSPPSGDITPSKARREFSGDNTPSKARREFIMSPPVATVKKAKSNESKGSTKAEDSPFDEADDKEEAAVEEPVDDEPAADAAEEEEVAEETPVEEEVEETAPVEEAAPVKEEEPSMFMSLLEKATALCGSMESAVENKNEALVSPNAEENVAPTAEAKASDLVSPLSKAKAAMKGCYNVEDSELIKTMSQNFTCQKDDLSMVMTESDEVVELKDTETALSDGDQKTVEPVEEEPEEEGEEEPAPVVVPVVEAPKKKMSMKKRVSQRFKAVKKVLSFRTTKPKVVVKADE